MKRFRTTLLAFFLITVLSACTSEMVSKTQTIKAQDVESLQVVGGLPGTKGSPLYRQTDDKGKSIIAKIVGWINSSKPVSGQTEYGKQGYPMFVNLKMNDGKMYRIEPAYNCVSVSDNSKTCTPVNDEIVLNQGSTKIRLASPELYEWLDNGWKQEE